MKAIIIAAGMGTRLKAMTKDQPKCLLKIQGLSLLERQLKIFRAHDIADISVVVGHQADKITIPGLRKYVNDDYPNNNILFSMMYAADELTEDIVVTYSDIIYRSEVVTKLLEAEGDILAVCDRDWKKTYIGRRDHPVDQAEKMQLRGVNAGKFGKHLTMEEADGEFIGLFRLSQRGAKIFREVYEDIRQKYKGRPFQKASVVEKSYVTDMLQELADRGHVVTPVFIEGGWREIDTEEDFEKANRIEW